MSLPSTRRASILACLLLLALANCGGGGGGGGDKNAGLVAEFTPACSSNADPCYTNSVTMQKGAASGSSFEVTVLLNVLGTSIGGADLTIQFDPTVVEYQGYVRGNALTGTLLVNGSGGQIKVSIAAATTAGQTLSTAKNLIKLEFKAIKAGSSSIAFVNPDTADSTALYDATVSANVIPLGLNGWSGGTVAVN